MEDIKPIIAKNISELRIKNGMTQLQFAEKLCYSDKAVSKWERAESIPDITVLMQIAKMFGVTLDYIVEADHSMRSAPLPATYNESKKHEKRNRGFITGISILLVWFIATFVFAVIDMAVTDASAHWLAFVYAVPVSMIVWLIFNSLWFNKRRNYLIISLLMWTLLASIFLTFLVGGINTWLIFMLGIIGQIVIIMWSGFRFSSR